MRLTLVFMWNSAQWEKFNFCFSKSLLLVLTTLSFWQGDWALGYQSKFRHFLDISSFPKIIFSFPKSQFVRQLLRQLVYTMFIGNDHPSFHFWWIENLVKHWKVSKYYETDCRLWIGKTFNNGSGGVCFLT